MALITFIIGACFLVPGSGGGGRLHASEVFGAVIAGVFTFCLFGGVWFGGAWIVYQAAELVKPVPGSGWAICFIFAIIVLPIVGVMASAQLFGWLFSPRRVKDSARVS